MISLSSNNLTNFAYLRQIYKTSISAYDGYDFFFWMDDRIVLNVFVWVSLECCFLFSFFFFFCLNFVYFHIHVFISVVFEFMILCMIGSNNVLALIYMYPDVSIIPIILNEIHSIVMPTICSKCLTIQKRRRRRIRNDGRISVREIPLEQSIEKVSKFEQILFYQVTFSWIEIFQIWIDVVMFICNKHHAVSHINNRTMNL